jgi:hsp70-interacting protein
MFIHNALPPLLNIIQPPTSSRQHPTSTRARATYALSSSVKHWPLAAHALSSASDQGYTVLAASAVDSAPIIRRKTAFLVHTLVLQSGEKYEGEIPKEVQALLEERMKQTAAGASSELLLDGLKRTGVLSSLVEGLKARASDEDIEFEENAIRALSQAAAKGGLNAEEKDTVKSIWENWGTAGQEERGLDGEDGKEIQRLLA